MRFTITGKFTIKILDTITILVTIKKNNIRDSTTKMYRLGGETDSAIR